MLMIDNAVSRQMTQTLDQSWLLEQARANAEHWLGSWKVRPRVIR
jgi:hypothetical protein